MYISLSFSLLFLSLIFFAYIRSNAYFKKNFSTSDEFLLDPKRNISSKVITGTGIIFLILFCLSNTFIFFFDKNILFPNRYFFSVFFLCILTIFSFFDDKKSIDPILRLIIQLICVYVSIASINISFFPIPLKVSMLIGIIIWIYLINITNFIDGSDGFCAVNTISFFIGLLVIDNYVIDLFSSHFAYILVPILLVFLLFNFPNAKIYMGDTGAVFLGYLIGFSFLEVAIATNIIYPIILFIYPILDCTITLIKKIYRGYMPWARHGDYFFLELKKKTPFKDRKIISLFLLKISFFQNMLNILFLFLAIYYKNNFILFFNLIFAAVVILIFYFKRINKI